MSPQMFGTGRDRHDVLVDAGDVPGTTGDREQEEEDIEQEQNQKNGRANNIRRGTVQQPANRDMMRDATCPTTP